MNPSPPILLRIFNPIWHLTLGLNRLWLHLKERFKPLFVDQPTSLRNRLTFRLQQHPCGYCYAPIYCCRWLELLILQWPAGSDSKPHSHLASVNLTKVLSGRVLERKYHISGGQLRVISERVVHTGQWAWTLPFEIHELVALDTTAETMHIYVPGRAL